MEVNVNYLAIVVAAVASMVVGFVWYGVLFKKRWMSLMGLTSDSMANMKMTANQAYMWQFVASLVMAYVLAHSILFANAYLNVGAIQAGVMVGFWNWFGFVAPVTIGIVLWENKPWTLWFLNVSNYLVSLIVMGVILSLWG